MTLSDLSYFAHGMNFLDSGEEVRSLWDEFNELCSTLRQQGIENGITATVRYRDLAGGTYEDRWNINPLLYEDESTDLGGLKSVSDLVAAVEKLSEHVEEISRSTALRQRNQQAEGSRDGSPQE